MGARRIARSDVVTVLLKGERIEDYPEDAPFPSALFFARVSDRPLHAVAAYGAERRRTYVITAYEPDSDHFEDDFRTRKVKP